MNKLKSVFETLSSGNSSSETNSFSGRKIAGTQHYLAKDELSRPVILISVLDSGRKTPGVSLQNLRVDHSVMCRVAQKSASFQEGVFSVLRCLSLESQIQNFFLETMQVLMNQLSDPATDIEVSFGVNQLCSLFAAMSRPNSKSVQSVWAELLVIVRSGNIDSFVEAWRIEESGAYDFNFGQLRIEVKSTSHRRRSHYFSFSQVYPPAGTQSVIASVFTDRVANGLSLGELWDSIHDSLGSKFELRQKLDQVCMASLGSSWIEARTTTFDREVAEQSLSFVDSANVPKVQFEQPSEISEIRFKSDISNVAPLDLQNFLSDI